jgi:hypothetical protein
MCHFYILRLQYQVNEEVSPMENEEKKKVRKTPDLKKGHLIWTIWNLTEAALLLVGGILAIVFSNNTDVQAVILPVVGGFMIAGGALKILMNFLPIVASNAYEAEAKVKAKAAMAYDLVIGGSFELALGATLITIYAQNNGQAVSAIVNFLSIFIAIILIVAGCSFLLFAIGFIVAKLYKLYMPILEIILGAALIALGVVVLVYMNKTEVFMQVVLIITGVIMALAGLGMLADTIRTVQTVKRVEQVAKAAKQVHEDVVASEAPVVDVTSEEGQSAVPEKKDDEKPEEPSEKKDDADKSEDADKPEEK